MNKLLSLISSVSLLFLLLLFSLLSSSMSSLSFSSKFIMLLLDVVFINILSSKEDFSNILDLLWK